MSFSWLQFVQARRIEYITAGPNTSHGNISVHCPLCGSGDPSMHMGLSLRSSVWGCWRNSSHRGRSPIRLIQALLGCSRMEAARLAGSPSGAVLEPDKALSEQVREMLGLSQASESPQDEPKLAFPPSIKPLTDKGLGKLYVSYLTSPERDYTRSEAGQLIQRYGFRYASEGAFKGRLVIPIYDAMGQLLTWTGRAIGSSNIRYKTLSPDKEKAEEQGLPIAKSPVTDCLLNLPTLMEGGKTLVLCEGPFDAIRLDYFGYDYDLSATCLFGLNLSQAQMTLLWTLSERFERKILLLDRDAQMASIGVSFALQRLGFKARSLSKVKDPALMSPEAIRRLAKE